MPAEFLSLHAEYSALKAKHPALADAYFGKHADRMSMFDDMLTLGKPGDRGEAVAFISSFGSQSNPRPKPMGEKQRGAARTALMGQHDAADWKIFSQQREPLRPDQAEQAIQGLEPIMERVMVLPGMSGDQAVRRALQRAKQDRGDDLLGGFYIRGTTGMQPLSTHLKTFRPGDPPQGTGEDSLDVWDKGLKGVMAARAKSLGIEADAPVVITRAPDRDGVAWMDVAFIKNDKPVYERISSQDIKNFVRVKPTAPPVAAKPGELAVPGMSTPLTLGSSVQPGDYDKGVAIVRQQIIDDMRKRKR